MERIKKSLGGIGIADAVLKHADGRIILCEIKASPLTTFPFLFTCPEALRNQELNQFTRTQINRLESGIYTHGDEIIPAGQPKDNLWPFKPAIDYLINPSNSRVVEKIVD